MNPTALLTYGVVIIALVVGARGALMRSTIAALKEQNDAFERREKGRAEDKVLEDAARAKTQQQTEAALAQLSQRNGYLEELVLRGSAIDGLTTLMGKHDEDAARRHADIIKVLRTVNSHLAVQAARREEEI